MTRSVNNFGILCFWVEFLQVLFDLRWMFVLMLFLIATDYWFGIRESHYKGEQIRMSRSWRRTLNKLVDYMSITVVGAILGVAICEPLGLCTHLTAAAVMLSIAALCELNSIIGHYLSMQGIQLSLIKVGLSFLKTKSKDIGKAVEDNITFEDKKDETNQ